MAFAAGSAVASPVQSILEVTPVLRVRVKASSISFGTMAIQTKIAVRMAGLASYQ
jgi:hypothetical protein